MDSIGKPRFDDDDRDDESEDRDSESLEGEGPGPDYVQKLNELMERAEPLIYQVNSSYQQYVAGVEYMPPNERAKQLEQMMNQLMLMAKPTPAYRFRYQNIQNTYMTYRKRWEKMLQDLDSGKIKRFAGPQKRRAG